MTEPMLEQTLIPSTPAPLAPRRQRADGATLIAGYHFVVAGIFLIITLLFAFPTLLLVIVGMAEDSGALIGALFTGLFSLLWMGLALLNLVVGYGVWTERSWGRTAALALAILRLINIPIGTATGGLALWYLLREDVAEQFK